MTIKFLKVKCGDAIIIHFLDSNKIGRNIIIDTGHHRKKIYPVFQKAVDEILQRGEKIDLLILTHRDDDHIGGVWKLINSRKVNLEDSIGCVWLNHSVPLTSSSSKISLRKTLDLKEVFQKNGKSIEKPITTLLEPFSLWGVDFVVLSPDRKSYEKEANNFEKKDVNRKISNKNDHKILISDIEQKMFSFKEDGSISNRSSIAFLLKYKEKQMLFLADSHSSVIINSLKKLGYSTKNQLKVDFVKVSHHGSKYNTSIELLSMIKCYKFIFSTNGKNDHNLPDKETLVRIIRNPERKGTQKVQIFFNHKDDVLSNLFEVDQNPFEEHNFELSFPEKNKTLTINI